MKPIDKKLLGPFTGTPPSLEWVEVDALQIDASYQRTMESSKSRRIVTGMVKTWDWRMCQPLVVTRRADGSLLVLDGQHRLEGARQRGDVPHLPCVILPAMAVEDEARTFVALNETRQKLSQLEIFRGMLVSGDADAMLVNAMIAETGWRLAPHTNTAHYKPGDLAVAPMLVRQVKTHGEVAVRNALVTLREAFPDKPVRRISALLKALIQLFVKERVRDPDALIEVLGDVEDPGDWMAFGHDMQKANPALSNVEGILEAIAEAVDDLEADQAGVMGVAA